MREIFKQYGGAILVGTAFTLLMAILFVAWPHGSLLADIGTRVKPEIEQSVNWNDQSDANALATHAKRNNPTIMVKTNLLEQSDARLSDLLTIKDTDGNVWNSSTHSFGAGGTGTVDVLSVKTSGAKELLDDTNVYDKSTETFHFPEPDTYVVQVRIQDHDNVMVVYKVPIAVDMNKPNRN